MKRLSAGSVATYKLFRKAFLDEYRPPLKIIKQIEAIRNFKQAPNEPLHCSWERFTESLFSCPEHKLNEHEQLRIFYQGLDVETRWKMSIDKALADLGAIISLISYSMYTRLDLGELKPTRMCIELANKSTHYPRGIAENVIVKIDKFIFPVHFVVLDMKEDHKIPIILRRPLMCCHVGSII
ncbi:integrase, catalytic region, zinc finger, CCHC-type containing protein [Tanacetum coccineum]